MKTHIEHSAVITVDGPSGSGKGTVSQILASRLNWHFLDSGAIYRVLALAVDRHGLSYDNEEGIAHLATHLDVQFVANEDISQLPTIILEQQDVSAEIRSEACGNIASEISSLAQVRWALLARQKAFAQPPGLVADGRDMGTVVFPDAVLKVFLDASVEERANRRYKQLQQRGINANLAQILADLSQRDERDRNRSVAPLRPAKDAELIDSSEMSIDEVVDAILELVKARGIN